MVRPSRSIAASTLILLLLLCLPVPAAPDTPLPQGEVAIRQAHMTLAVYTREAEMNAAITYITPLIGADTARMNNLFQTFRDREAAIPSATTASAFANLTREMRMITADFRNETAVQLAKGNGKEYDLTLSIREATANNPYIEEKRQAYWNTRKARQLADFDIYLRDAQSSLDLLRAKGYPVSAAQRTLDVLASNRPDLASALDARDEARIAGAAAVILPLSQDLGRQVAEAQAEISEADRMAFLIDQGYRAVNRADTTNTELTKILLDIGPAEPATRQLKIDLAAAKRALSTGNLPTAKPPLILVKKDLKDLSMSYRGIANSADLPPDLSASLRALVITLDTTADLMGVD
jgi:hypothetical protein